MLNADVEMLDPGPGQFLPLQSGVTFDTVSNREVWDSIPTLLKDFDFWQLNAHPQPADEPSPYWGKLQVQVVDSGVVWMATTTRFGGGGNSSGGWTTDLLTTHQDLLDSGWELIDTGLTSLDLPTQQTMNWNVYRRSFTAGDRIEIRTEKYIAPVILRSDAVVPEPTSLALATIGTLALLLRNTGRIRSWVTRGKPG